MSIISHNSPKVGAHRKKMGRPTVFSIDVKQLDSLLEIQCTLAECSAFFRCSEDTLERFIQKNFNKTYADYSREKRGAGKTSLRRRQFQKAVETGDTTMLIWLGKQYLGQSEKVQHNVEGEINHNHFIITPEMMEEMQAAWDQFQPKIDVSRN